MICMQAHITTLLARNGLTPLADQAGGAAQGFLNTVVFAKDNAGARYVLRMVRHDNRDDIEGYITRQIAHLGAAGLGGRLHYRSVAEQVAMHNRLRAASITAPEVTTHGDDWMLMRHVDGRSLRDIYMSDVADKGVAASCAVLAALMEAHAKGICLWDRWGGNELVDDTGNVCFIDFDIDIALPNSVDVRVAGALDLVFFLRGCVQYSTDPGAIAKALTQHLCACADVDHIYDRAALLRFLDGQLAFYQVEYIDNAAIGTPLQHKHAHDNALIAGLRDAIAAMPWPQKSPAATPRGFQS